MPTLNSDGTLGEKMYVVLSEVTGNFPKSGHINLPNLVVRASKSHIMTKALMKDWFQEVIFDQSMPDDILLVVDSWKAFNDVSFIQSLCPPNKRLKILQIPAGCTGTTQPLDVGFFRGFKGVIRRISGSLQEDASGHKHHLRDNILKVYYFLIILPIDFRWSPKYTGSSGLQNLPTTSSSLG